MGQRGNHMVADQATVLAGHNRPDPFYLHLARRYSAALCLFRVDCFAVRFSETAQHADIGRNRLYRGAILFTGVFGFLHFAADPVTADNPVFSELSAELATEEALQLVEARHEAEMIAAGHHGEWVAKNISVYLPEQFSSLLMYGFETVPLILIGMALYRYGVFDGTADGTRLRRWGWIMVVGGTVLSVPIALWALDDGLSYYGTLAAVAGYGSLPRLPVIVGLAFLLSLWGAHAHGWLGQRISAAGRAAFTNYLGTSMVMMLIFWGWAGGLYGKLTRSELYLVMLLGWAVMLLWSKPWLDRFRYGPLEWVWRCLTYGRLFPLRR